MFSFHPKEMNREKHLGAEYFNTLELLAYFYNHSPDPSQVVANDRFDLVKSVNPDSKKSNFKFYIQARI